MSETVTPDDVLPPRLDPLTSIADALIDAVAELRQGSHRDNAMMGDLAFIQDQLARQRREHDRDMVRLMFMLGCVFGLGYALLRSIEDAIK